ncbi:glycosyltransferase family 4 protein [Knoellia sp. CPCC 206435]|uniref:glycosyltransferase family 4 protein n=1 Tax=Knoellia terrae TaxID=3404797 RepID=UPI003B42D14F
MTRGTRVLYVIDSLAPGGAETSLALLAPRFPAHGIELIVQPLKPSSGLVEMLQASGTRVLPPPPRHGRLSNIRHLVGAVRTHRPDLLHTTLFEADVAGSWAGRVTATPVSSSIVKVPGSPGAEGISRWKLRAAQLLGALSRRHVRAWHVLTDTVARESTRVLGIPHESVTVIPRGRDPESFPFRDARRRADTRSSLGLTDANVLLLAVARQEYVKGIDRLITAAELLRSTVPGVVLLIAGKQGRASDDLAERAAGVAVDVRFLGHRTDIADLLSAADVFCVPSRQEGICGALIEAMAVGVPSVVSDLPTLKDVLGRDEPCGLLADFDDPADVVRSMESVLSRTAATEEMTRRARARFERHYTLESAAASMADFFRATAKPPQ